MNTLPKRARRAGRRTQGGFGLLEALIAMSLIALVFLGGMDLIINSSRLTVRTQSQMYATADAANCIQSIISQVREAQSFTLPTSQTANTAEDGWIALTNTTLSQFSTTLNGFTVNTAIQITAPPALTPAANNYKAGVLTIQVQKTTGGSGPGSYWSVTPYDSRPAGTAVTLIYRGDPNGTPDPNPTGSAVAGAGTYLWQYTVPANNSFDVVAHPPVALCKSVSTSPNAVQFVRPADAGVPQPFQAEVKIISAYYSPINGTETNEEGDANGDTSSQLTGKCVYMRDHQASPPAKTNISQSSNNPFQHH